MTNAQQDAVEAGQAVYSPLVLSVYDILVLGISNRLLWRCPTPGLVDLYNRNLGARHLDIGVGTGYFLDHAKWPVSRPDITLLDLNPNSLAAAARRIGYEDRRSSSGIAATALTPRPLPYGGEGAQSRRSTLNRRVTSVSALTADCRSCAMRVVRPVASTPCFTRSATLRAPCTACSLDCRCTPAP